MAIFDKGKCFYFKNVRLFHNYNDQDSTEIALVEVMAWHQPGAKPLPQLMMTQFINV